MAERVRAARKRRGWRWPGVAVLAWVGWCAPLQGAPQVVTSIAPVHSLAAAVMGDAGRPLQIVRGYGSPHAYQMRPSDAAYLRDADLVFWIGPSLETFLERPLSRRRDATRIVALSAIPGLRLLANRPGGVRDGAAHSHAHAGAGSFDPHIWLSPFNAKLIAGAIAEQLAALDPANAGLYAMNLGRLQQRIDTMQSNIRTRLAPVANTPFVVFHDSFQYFEASFGLNALGSVTVSPEQMPSARRIRALKEAIEKSAARCVFREPQFESALMQVFLEDSKVRAGVLDPLGTDITPGPEAYFDLMNGNADALLECLAE